MKVTKPRRAACATATCRHEPCWRDRAVADSRCSRCGEPIGFNTEYEAATGPEDFASTVYTHKACVLPAGSIFT